jgi:hypothetical protein
MSLLCSVLLLVFFLLLSLLPLFSHNQQQFTQTSPITLSRASVTTIITYIVRGSSFAHGHRCFLDCSEALWQSTRGSLVPFSKSSRKQILVQIYLLFRGLYRVGASPTTDRSSKLLCKNPIKALRLSPTTQVLRTTRTFNPPTDPSRLSSYLFQISLTIIIPTNPNHHVSKLHPQLPWSPTNYGFQPQIHQDQGKSQ